MTKRKPQGVSERISALFREIVQIVNAEKPEMRLSYWVDLADGSVVVLVSFPPGWKIPAELGGVSYMGPPGAKGLSS